MSAQTSTDGFAKWQPLHGAYFDPSDLSQISRAQSALVGFVGVVDLDIEQARDILAWYDPKH
jgi:hypothetical protein